MQAHTGVRRHICAVCQRSFGRLDNCQKHERSHRCTGLGVVTEGQWRSTPSTSDAADAADAADADAANEADLGPSSDL